MNEDAKKLAGPSPPDVLPDPAEHPDPDRLYAYQANELTPDEDLEIQEHLAVCGHCTELLLDIHRFTTPPAEEEAGLSEFEQAAGWRKLRTRLDQDGFFTRNHRPRRQIVTIAAVFVLAILGLSIYNLTHRTETGATYSLDPLDSTRGETSEKLEEVKLPATLQLLSQASTHYDEYVAKVEDSKGREVRRFPGLRQDAAFRVALKLQQGDLPPGEYWLELTWLRNGRPEGVANFGFKIVKDE